MQILYADGHIAVCIKPSGVLSQDAGENSMPGLLRKALGREAVYTVHRLDREAAGVMVYGLSQKAAAGLSKAIQEQKLEKTYLAVLGGIPQAQEASLEDLLFHDKMKNKTYVVKRERKGVRDARLDYRVLGTAGEQALVQIRLHTGRTHQIRVQFASRGLPLAGDGKYGGRASGAGLALWSYRLVFPHPVTKKTMEFQQLPPAQEPWNLFAPCREA